MHHLYKRFGIATAAVCLLLTGCSSYQPGQTENGVYRNETAEFQITTPEEYTCYDSDHFGNCSYYSVNVMQAAARGAGDSFICEYAAKSVGCEALVCSEENVHDDTLQSYAERLGSQIQITLLDLQVQEIEDVRLGGKIFKKVGLSTGDFDINVYIRQVDDTFVYLYHMVMHHEWVEGEEQALLDCVAGIG